ncbi:MAG: alpha-amylase [Candidatus Izemoplasmatales bacterium]
MRKGKLEKLAKVLENKIALGRINYVVPDIWNAWDYDGPELRRLPSEELLVNPYRFFATLIREWILIHKAPNTNYRRSLSAIDDTANNGDWLKRSTLYSLMVRTSAAWDHDRSHSLDSRNFDNLKETGTFVKALALLPFLVKMGVDTIYLLPVTKFSRNNKKGELGSPYAVSNYTELDPELKDDLTGSEMTLDEEFQAFVEACHILSIRVTIDIMPRTIALDNAYLKKHPEWFYWIKASEAHLYKTPKIEGLGNTLPPESRHMEKVYASEAVKNHLRLFQKDPKATDKDKWQKLIDDNPDDFLQEISKRFDLTVAPAFSDHINDIQPPWTDITFLRLYLDHPTANIKYLDNPKIPPYILFDTIKANLHPGKKPNKVLWRELAKTIPHFQKRFGIDGARIDMGHALPAELLEMIITRARDNDSDFGLIAEELNPDNAKKAKDLGYNIMIGNGFWMEPRFKEGFLQAFIERAIISELPMFATPETHDSKRIAAREGGIVLSRMLAIFNMLLPNLVPFINSGQEFYETQPMNIGVDCVPKDRFSLPKNDIFYGKLALFDKYALHYLHPRRWEIADHLRGIKEIRKQWLKQLTDPEAALILSSHDHNSRFIAVGYFDKASGSCLVVAGNPDPAVDVNGHVPITLLRERAQNRNLQAKLLYSTYSFGGDYSGLTDDSLYLGLKKGEVKVISF